MPKHETSQCRVCLETLQAGDKYCRNCGTRKGTGFRDPNKYYPEIRKKKRSYEDDYLRDNSKEYGPNHR